MNDQPPLENVMPEPSKQKTFKVRGFTPLKSFGDKKDIIVKELREFYLEQRKAGRTDLMQIFRDFRKDYELTHQVWFNPDRSNIQGWIKLWEKMLPATMRQVIQAKDVKTQATEASLIKEIAYHDLESGSKNLQALLIEDAQAMLTASNEKYQAIDESGGMWDAVDFHKIQLKRKEVALAIADKVLSGVHKHELIGIKKNKEGRETAGFMMDLIKQAGSGELSDQDISLLEQGVNA